MSFKLDLHVHTESHGKTYISVDQLQQSLKHNGIDGIAVTNFFDISHAVWLKEKLKEHIIIVGQEIWTTEGHIVGLGLKERIADSQDAADTIGLIHDQGGLAVAPHPFLFLGIGKGVVTLPFDAIEAYNGLLGPTIIFNYMAKRMAVKMNVSQIASTDTTNPLYIGHSYTNVLVEEPDQILRAVQLGKIKLRKRALPLPLVFIIKSIMKLPDLDTCSLHAVPCFICGKSMVTGLFKEECCCFDCGKKQWSRVSCCNGHFLCVGCVVRRGQLVAKAKEMSMIEGSM
jgi:hypothetical protein